MQTTEPTPFRLSDEQETLRSVIRDMASAVIEPVAAAVDSEERFPTEAYQALRAAELHAPHIPEAYGGAGADALSSCIVVEEIARVCASSSMIPAANKLATTPLLLAGSDDLKQSYLPQLAAGDVMASYALSEREAGSDIASMRCRAVPAGGDWVLTGQKSWISNAGVSDFYTVFAVTDPDAPRGRHVSAFVVEKTDDGVSFGAPERKMGLKGSPTREVLLDQVRIPDARMIGEPGQGLKIALETLDHSRVTVGAQAIGIAQGAFDFALSYVKERSQFGKRIAEFQAIQFMLADMAMAIESSRQLVYAAASRSECRTGDLGFFGAAAKCHASDAAMQVTTDAVQLLGGYGYTKDFPVERMMRDAKITQIYEGTNQIQRVVMARHLLAQST